MTIEDYKQFVSKITEKNFPKILEVSQDIYDAIQTHPENEDRAVISLEPVNTNDNRDRYKLDRKRALGYLQIINVLERNNLGLENGGDKRKQIAIKYTGEFFTFLTALFERKEKSQAVFSLKSKTNKIESIICVLPREGKIMLLVINQDYNNPLTCSLDEKYWSTLQRVADEEQVPFDKSFIDYMNSNRSNQLFTSYKIKPFPMFKRDGGVIKPIIELGSIPFSVYIRRRGKFRKEPVE